MGQLLNRIGKIAKSYSFFNLDDNINSIPKINDEELKKIIDGLNANETENEKKSSGNINNINAKMKIPNLEQAYIILDINDSYDIESIKSAYRKKIKEYHPDKVSALGLDLRNLAEQKTIEINRAYEIIRKSKGF